jgi:hypothetical protein
LQGLQLARVLLQALALALALALHCTAHPLRSS